MKSKLGSALEILTENEMSKVVGGGSSTHTVSIRVPIDRYPIDPYPNPIPAIGSM